MDLIEFQSWLSRKRRLELLGGSKEAELAFETKQKSPNNVSLYTTNYNGYPIVTIALVKGANNA